MAISPQTGLFLVAIYTCRAHSTAVPCLARDMQRRFRRTASSTVAFVAWFSIRTFIEVAGWAGTATAQPTAGYGVMEMVGTLRLARQSPLAYAAESSTSSSRA